MALQWKDDLLIGVNDIDNQHKELFTSINKLLEAMREGKGKEVTEETFSFLQDYTKTHFKNEERLMQKYKYPELTDHKSYHEQYMKSINEMNSKLQKEGATMLMVLELQRFLSNWWTNHINKVDKKLGAFLKDNM